MAKALLSAADFVRIDMHVRTLTVQKQMSFEIEKACSSNSADWQGHPSLQSAKMMQCITFIKQYSIPEAWKAPVLPQLLWEAPEALYSVTRDTARSETHVDTDQHMTPFY